MYSHEYARLISANDLLAMMYWACLEIGKFMFVNMESDSLRLAIHSGNAIDILEVFMNIDVNWNIFIKQRRMEGNHTVKGIG